MSTLNFLVETLLSVYIFILLLRVWMQFTRADFYNPASQFVVKITQPIVGPIRRMIPALGPIDTASVLIALLLSTVKYPILFWIATGTLPIDLKFILLGGASLLKSFGRLIFWLILIRAIMSWISRGRNPIDYLLYQLTEPLMAPIRRFVPAMGGIDFSPMILFFILYGLNMLGVDIIGPTWVFL